MGAARIADRHQAPRWPGRLSLRRTDDGIRASAYIGDGPGANGILRVNRRKPAIIRAKLAYLGWTRPEPYCTLEPANIRDKLIYRG